jgi:hypothetical protein
VLSWYIQGAVTRRNAPSLMLKFDSHAMSCAGVRDILAIFQR